MGTEDGGSATPGGGAATDGSAAVRRPAAAQRPAAAARQRPYITRYAQAVHRQLLEGKGKPSVLPYLCTL